MFSLTVIWHVVPGHIVFAGRKTPWPSSLTACIFNCPGSDFIRFVPKKNAATTATLTAYAWDGTGGFSGTSWICS